MHARSSKPLLIALEGPAGAGKSTLQKHLCRQFREKGIEAACIPEFSKSDLGKELRANAQYGQSKPVWTIGVGGTLAFLADRINLLDNVPESPVPVWICDRFVTSQLALSLREIDDVAERAIAKDIILLTLAWSASRFSSKSLVVFLEAPFDVLEERLSRRIGHPLTQSQSLRLQEEIREYSKLSSYLRGWNKTNVSSIGPIDLLSRQLVNTISSQWQD